MWTELTDQLKSSANRWLLQVVGSLAGVMGVSAFVLVKAPIAQQYGMLLTLGLFGLWIVFALVSYTRRHPASSAPVPVTTEAHVMGPESRPALDAALQWLESKTQAPRKEAARDRPWFLVIGGSKSGKTTLLAGTGLEIQFPAWGNRPAEARATQGYGVYITDRAVMLDTPGEFLSTSRPGASDALVRLLKQVARLRPHEPLNGILVVIDAPRLLQLAKPDVQSLALTYRDQLQKISRAIGRTVPVQLLVSKCDELRDFDAFFSDLAVHHPLTPAWGFELTDAERESRDWLSHCDRGLSDIYQRLVVRRTAQLRVTDESARGAIIEFPERFQEVRDRLRIFLEPLFGRTRTSGYSLIRGVFFLGALGGDAPAKSMAVVPRRFAESARTLLREVVFAHPSRGSATGWREVWASMDVPAMVLGGVALALTGLMAFAVYPAYRDNVRVVRAQERVARSREGALPERSVALAELRESVVSLGADEHVAPTRTWHWTMFAGHARLAAALRALEDATVQTFIEGPGECGATLEQALTSERDGGRLYRTLKTYLMVTAPGRPQDALTAQDRARDAQFMLAPSGPLAGCWARRLPDAGAARAHLMFFVHRLTEHPGRFPLPAPGSTAAQTVAGLRGKLAEQNDIQSYYEQLAGLTSDAVPSVELIAVAHAADVFAAQAKATTSATAIPGVFTRAGWETLAQPSIQQLTQDYARERAWVLGLPANASQVRDELRRRYFAEYRERWTRAVQAVRAIEFQGWTNAERTLLAVSGDRPDTDPSTSAYYRLLAVVADNTWGRNPADAAPGEFTANAAGFRSLHSLVAMEPGKPSELQHYLVAVHALFLKMSSYQTTDSCPVKLEALPAIGQAVREATEVAARIRPSVDASLSSVGTLLIQPVNAVASLRSTELNKCQTTPLPPPPPGPGVAAPLTLTFTVTIPSIKLGEASLLQWTSEGATNLTLTPGVGAIGSSGSMEVRPTQTTTYVLEGRSGSGVFETKTVVVEVQVPPVPVKPTDAIVSGMVTAGGKPERNAEVFLRNVATRATMTTKSGSDGHFRFNNAVDLSGAFEICYSKDSSCRPVGKLESGVEYAFEERGFVRFATLQGTRRVVVKITLTP